MLIAKTNLLCRLENVRERARARERCYKTYLIAKWIIEVIQYFSSNSEIFSRFLFNIFIFYIQNFSIFFKTSLENLSRRLFHDYCMLKISIIYISAYYTFTKLLLFSIAYNHIFRKFAQNRAMTRVDVRDESAPKLVFILQVFVSNFCPTQSSFLPRVQSRLKARNKASRIT